jgi:hypothetical protein
MPSLVVQQAGCGDVLSRVCAAIPFGAKMFGSALQILGDRTFEPVIAKFIWGAEPHWCAAIDAGAALFDKRALARHSNVGHEISWALLIPDVSSTST